MPKLADQHIKNIIHLLNEGKELPPDYRYLLFPPERQEYELIYADKEREEDILAETMAVPLQPIKVFGNVKESSWQNMLIFGDNLQAMKTLLQWKKEGKLINSDGSKGVKMIYIDPPFATRKEFRGSQDERAYQDKIVGAKFLEFLRKRLILLKELLAKDGCIYIHLDYKKGHYIKVILDEIFGEHNFRNEIVVRRTQKSFIERDYINSLNVGFDTIYLYAASNAVKFAPVFKKQEISETWHSLDAPNWSGTRPNLIYELFGHWPPKGRCWAWEPSRAKEATKKGDLRPNPRTGKPEYRIPARSKTVCTNLWDDISAYSFHTGYPTEKHEKLLKRLIEMGSHEGDIILDAFAGSGTTLIVSEKLNRRWIGIDCGKLAIYTIQKRILSSQESGACAFALYNAGLYDFSQLKRLQWDDWRFFALRLFQCQDESHEVGGVRLDGYRNNYDVLVFNHLQYGGVVLDYGFVDDLHNQLGEKIGSQFFIIAPAASVTFLEDYVDKGKTRYYILRIPYSIINELHACDFEAIAQPIDENQVNETVDAVGFDFVRLPEVSCEYLTKKLDGNLFEEAIIQIKTFKSKAMVKGATQKNNLETLSMVMIDYEYDNEVFNLDDVFYAKDIEKNNWEVRIPSHYIGKQMMIIYIDVYGNEYREIKTPLDFHLTNETIQEQKDA